MSKLSDIGYIKSLLEKYGFKFSKSLGQNFLINPSVCPRMASECVGNDAKKCGIIEIGPGAGVLTYELAQVAGKVAAIELDRRLLPVLDESLKEFNNIKIINADAMKFDFHKLISEEFNGMNVYICANLPYYITSPVIMNLLEQKLPVKAITVMVQKEAADRICALPGTRNVGAVSIAVRYYCEPEILFKVSAGSFLPAPKVDSAVIKLNISQKPTVNVKDEKLFFKVVKSAFCQRRKTLVNSVSFGMNINKMEILNIVNDMGLKPTVRAEELTMQNFADLSNIITEKAF